MERTKRPLTRGVKLSYGVGQAAEGIKNAAFNVFIFFYYTQVLGLSAAYTGIAIGIALAVDSISDPLIGSLSDNWPADKGRRHPFIYASALPLGLAFIGLFSPPELDEFSLFVWLTVFSVGTRAMMTLFYVPHVALGAELSEDFNERTAVVSYRYFFSYIGGILTYVVGFVIYFPDTQFDKTAYAPFGVTMSLMMMVTIILSAFGTRSRVPLLPKSKVNRSKTSLWIVLKNTPLELISALANDSFRWLFTGVLIVFAMVGVDNALNLHMNTYFWELRGGGNLFFFAAMPVGALLGAGFASTFTRLFDKKPSVIIGTLCWALCQVIPVVLRLLDWFPENGSDELLYTLVLIKFVQGFGVVQALIAFNSMVADVVDEHELVTGLRQEGIFFSSVSFSNKMTSGLGTVAAGFALTLIDWPTGTDLQSAADVDANTISWLGLIYGPIVSGFALVSVYCYSQYRLDRQRHNEIVNELIKLRVQRSGLQ